MAENVLVTPFFKTVSVQDKQRSRENGRPCFKDVEYVEIRIAGDRNYAPCFPALSMWKRVEGQEVTYAERWPEQYRRFKENLTQIAEGTPLSEAPFLTEAKRSELRALKIYTVEALASLEGKNLKTLGMDGNDWKQKAKAYLESAHGSASVVRMAETIAALQQQVEELKAAGRAPIQPVASEPFEEPASPTLNFEGFTDDQIKDWIAGKTGQGRPRGNPARDTLIQMANELEGAAA